GDARPVVAPRDRVVAEWAVPVQGQDAGAAARRLPVRRQQVERQWRLAVRLQDQLVTAVVLQFYRPLRHGSLLLRRREVAQEGAQLGGELGLPAAALVGGAAAEPHRQRGGRRLLLDPVVDGRHVGGLFGVGRAGAGEQRRP